MRRVVLLTLGWEDLPKSVSVHGAPPEERLREPVPGVLLQCDGGWLLLDTGFNPALIRDPALRRRFHGDPAFRPVLPGPGEPLEEALADAGIGMDEITRVAVSHLHNDHAGGLRHFAGRVPVHAQRGRAGIRPVRPSRCPSTTPSSASTSTTRPSTGDLADGDAEIAPGVTAVLTAGHTPGHQSFVVDLDESVGGGGLVFAFDAADLTENIDHELAVGGFIGVTPEETVEPIRRLKRLAAERGYQLVPGHDPVVWPALTRTLAERFATTG